MEYQEAIDTILQFANETPVNAPNEHPLQGVVERYLRNSLVREQLVGWWFNVDHNLTLQVATDGTVPIAKELKQIVFNERYLIDRGDKVYDSYNNTYIISRDVEAIQAIRVLEWEKTPELMQQWCMFQAAKYYIISTIGDAGITKEMKDEATRTFVMLKAQDIKSKNINIFNTPEIAKFRLGRNPYNGR